MADIYLWVTMDCLSSLEMFSLKMDFCVLEILGTLVRYVHTYMYGCIGQSHWVSEYIDHCGYIDQSPYEPGEVDT